MVLLPLAPRTKYFYFPTKHLRIQDSVHMGMDVLYDQAQLNLCI